MKILKKIMIVFLLFTALHVNKLYAQTDTKQAIVYMNELFVSFEDVKKDTWKYLKAVTGGKNILIVEKKRKNLLAELKTQKGITQKKEGYHSDVELRDAIIKYLDLSYTVLNEDFDKIMDMEEIAEQSYDLMEAYMLAKEKANQKLHTAFEGLNIAQKSFAEKHNINLLEGGKDKISQKIKRANEALKYYNKLYLIFFKCYKQEAYVLDAQNRNDISGVEQNVNTLSSFANESLQEIKPVGSFKGDVSLKSALRQIVSFYDREAKKDFPVITDFYIKKDNFEKLGKLMNSKKKKDLTKEDIDKYNKSVNEYNKAVKDVNKVNTKMNQQRKKYLGIWNNSVDKFFDKHTN